MIYIEMAPSCRRQLPMLPRVEHSANGLTGEDWSGWISSNGAREEAEVEGSARRGQRELKLKVELGVAPPAAGTSRLDASAVGQTW